MLRIEILNMRCELIIVGADNFALDVVVVLNIEIKLLVNNV